MIGLCDDRTLQNESPGYGIANAEKRRWELL